MSEAPPSTPETEAPPPESAKVQPLAELWRALIVGLQTRIELISLDIQRAGLSLAQMLVLMAMCVCLLSTAWVALMVGIALLLWHFGWASGWIVALVVVINVVGAWWTWHRVTTLTHYLTLPGVRAHLLGTDHE